MVPQFLQGGGRPNDSQVGIVLRKALYVVCFRVSLSVRIIIVVKNENELVLLLSTDGAVRDNEECYRVRWQSGTRLILRLSPTGVVLGRGDPGEDCLAEILANDGHWWISPVDEDRMPRVNGESTDQPRLLGCGDLLTWNEINSVVACHPTIDPFPGPEGMDSLPTEPQDSAYWLRTLKETGRQTAEFRLFHRYYPRILDVARATLGNVRLRSFDEEDVATEAFSEFYAGLRGGKFNDLNSRRDLWALLVCITRRRAIDRLRRSHATHRAPDQLRGESVFQFNSIDDMPEAQRVGSMGDVTEISVIDGDDEVEHFLNFLRAVDPQTPLDRIARLRMDGVSNTEISAELEISLRSVERATGRIRNLWQQHAGRNPEF